MPGTGLMTDMKTIIGEYYRPDLAILPIGNVFTMGPLGSGLGL